MKKKLKAFTLAEVLITLAIVGVVAAMTLPTILANKQKKELEVAFKKSYSTLSQAWQRVLLEDYGGSYPGFVSPTNGNYREVYDNIAKYYIKSAVCTYGGQVCSDSVFPMKKFSATNAASFMQSNYKSFTGGSGIAFFNDGILAASDGSFLYFDVSTSESFLYGTLLIAIDTNGWRKKPNRYGYDFFAFQVSQTGQLLPMGADGTAYSDSVFCSKTSMNFFNGMACSVQALNNPNWFKELE